MWLSGLSASLRAKGLLVRFLVRAHAWAAGLVPRWDARRGQLIDVSLTHQCFSPSLSPSPLLSEHK